MLPKQENLGLADSSDTKSESPQFGSQMVDENSTTPYTDATQVCAHLISYYLEFFFFTIRFKIKSNQNIIC